MAGSRAAMPSNRQPYIIVGDGCNESCCLVPATAARVPAARPLAHEQQLPFPQQDLPPSWYLATRVCVQPQKPALRAPSRVHPPSPRPLRLLLSLPAAGTCGSQPCRHLISTSMPYTRPSAPALHPTAHSWNVVRLLRPLQPVPPALLPARTSPATRAMSTAVSAAAVLV